jgi:HEAT repeat protein
VNVGSVEYEQKLIELIPQGDAAKRAEICLLLGQRKNQAAISPLVSLLCIDPEMVVRVAALRALSEIGNASALDEIAKVAVNEANPVRGVAKQILKTLKARAGGHETGLAGSGRAL